MVLFCENIERREFLLENGSHPTDSALIVTDGSFSCEMEGRSYAAHKNEIFIFKKGVVFKRKIQLPLKAVYILFDSLPNYRSGLLTTTYLSRTAENVALLQSAIRGGRDSERDHYIADLLITHSQMAPARRKNSLAETCSAYFEAHYSEAVALDSLAKSLYVTKQGLIKSFKAFYHQTPMAYLHALRLRKSKALLLSTEKSVSEIAELCGFRNIYYFSACFKKQFGMSPLQYRNRLQL